MYIELYYKYKNITEHYICLLYVYICLYIFIIMDIPCTMISYDVSA